MRMLGLKTYVRSRNTKLASIAIVLLAGLAIYAFIIVNTDDRQVATPSKSTFILANRLRDQLAVRDQPKSVGEPLKQNSAPLTASAWPDSFKNLRNEKPRLTVHRAAVSGKLSDVVAARWQHHFCSKFSKDGEVLISTGMTKQPGPIEYFRKMQESCFADAVQSPDTLVVKDDQGFGKSADALAQAAAGNAIVDSSIRREVLKHVLETESLDLLAAVSRRVLVKEDIYDLGLQPSEQVEGTTDEIMLDMAIQIAACTQRGDCDKVALENIDCDLYKSYVTDLRNFPEKRIFGETTDLTFFVTMGKTQDPSVLRSRWVEINKFLKQLRHTD